MVHKIYLHHGLGTEIVYKETIPICPMCEKKLSPPFVLYFHIWKNLIGFVCKEHIKFKNGN